jgi:hypothetical protein
MNHVMLKPFKNEDGNMVETLSLCVLGVISLCSVRVGSFLEAAVVPSSNSPASGVTEDLNTMIAVLYYVVVATAAVAVVWGYASWRWRWRSRTMKDMVGRGVRRMNRMFEAVRARVVAVAEDGMQLSLLEGGASEEGGGGGGGGGEATEVEVLESQLRMERGEIAKLRARAEAAEKRVEEQGRELQEVKVELLRERRRLEEAAAAREAEL